MHGGILSTIESIEEKVEYICNLFLNHFDTQTPVIIREKQLIKYTSRLTDDMKFLRELCNKSIKRFQNRKQPPQFDNYKQLYNYTSGAIRAEKKTYIHMKMMNSSTREKINGFNKLCILLNKNI